MKGNETVPVQQDDCMWTLKRAFICFLRMWRNVNHATLFQSLLEGSSDVWFNLAPFTVTNTQLPCCSPGWLVIMIMMNVHVKYRRVLENYPLWLIKYAGFTSKIMCQKLFLKNTSYYFIWTIQDNFKMAKYAWGLQKGIFPPLKLSFTLARKKLGLLSLLSHLNFILLEFCDDNKFFQKLVSPVQSTGDMLPAYRENHGGLLVTFNL